MDKLKPCPFCGGEATIRKYEYFSEDTYNVYCEECGCEISMYYSEGDAIDAWNRRAE